MADISEESPAQRQARLRREKRNAKITGEGSDRLAKITGVSGRSAPAPENVSAPQSPPQEATSPADDPAEVEISEHHWNPSTNRPPPSIPSLPADGSADDPAADPMMRMMQQMLGQMPGGDPNAAPNGSAPELPPFLQALMSGQAKTQQQEAQQPPPNDSAYIWRILHAVFALSLALYIVMTSTFNGTKLSRYEKVDGEEGPRLFYIFATVETVLQSSRYFLEKGQLGGTGWLATISNSGMVPEPFNGYLRIAGRYATIWSTVVGDAMTVVFVLGAVAWWRGLNAA